jgi:GntR family transcriptional regulator/MocR family aminotransferase
LRKAIQAVLRRDGAAALEYGEHRGHAPLRSTIAHILASQGLMASPEHILITAGSQQALALVAQLLLQPGDVALVESPTYTGILDLFRALGLKIVGVPIDAGGMKVDELEKLLQQHHPKLIYTIPNFQNPTGTCLNGRRRHQLIALADRYNVPILEDDFVGDLRYEGRTQPALKGLDPGGRVIYASTFSKMLMPGLRVGFLVADGPVYERLVHRKRINDLATSNLMQRALEEYVTVGRYQAHLRRSCRIYRRRRDRMLQAIDRYLPIGVQVVPPQGGFFVWLCLPNELSAEALLPLACEEGVAFSPGSRFFPSGVGGECCMRLNFASQTPEGIEEGLKRLGQAIRRLPSAC